MTLNNLLQAYTNLNAETLKERIYLQINKGKYSVVRMDNLEIIFNSRSSGIPIRGESYNKLNSGKFEIYSYKDLHILKFTYCTVPSSEILIILILFLVISTITIISRQYEVGIVAIPFILQLLHRLIILKNVAKHIFAEIIKPLEI